MYKMGAILRLHSDDDNELQVITGQLSIMCDEAVKERGKPLKAIIEEHDCVIHHTAEGSILRSDEHPVVTTATISREGYDIEYRWPGHSPCALRLKVFFDGELPS